MRKMSNAESMDKGIVFFSNKHKDYVAMATINEQGEIKAEWITIREYKNYKNNNRKNKTIMNMFYFTLFLLTTVFVVLSDRLFTQNLILGMRFFLIGVVLITLAIFISINIIEKNKKEWRRFHSAEHMVLNAYKKLKRVPSLSEISQFSRFNNVCGTNIYTQIIINFSLMFICTFISNPFYELIGMLLVNALVPNLVQNGFLNFLQKFTTMSPTDKHLIVAIEGLTVLLKNEI